MLKKIQQFLVEGFRKKDGDSGPRSPLHQLLALVVLAVLCLGLFFWHQQSTKRAAEKAAQERQQRMEQETLRRAQQMRPQQGQQGMHRQQGQMMQNGPMMQPGQQGQMMPQGPVPTGPKVRAQTPPMIQPKVR
ncbi:hypothetical protein [Acidaminococcus timonensis]|uniref:hypothetical protein n=1 Tax=Acidaminococcus timonensis TaxID=1871002 RepID=UPI00307CB3FF